MGCQLSGFRLRSWKGLIDVSLFLGGIRAALTLLLSMWQSLVTPKEPLKKESKTTLRLASSEQREERGRRSRFRRGVSRGENDKSKDTNQHEQNRFPPCSLCLFVSIGYWSLANARTFSRSRARARKFFLSFSVRITFALSQFVFVSAEEPALLIVN